MINANKIREAQRGILVMKKIDNREQLSILEKKESEKAGYIENVKDKKGMIIGIRPTEKANKTIRILKENKLL